MSPRRPDVLLVEDDAAIREALSEFLQDEGYRVQTAVHGQAAMEALESGAMPRLILLDLMMPVMDGWQFMRQFSTHDDWAKIPVIVVSAAREPMPDGACQCLSKPVDLSMLFEAMAPLRAPRPSAEEPQDLPPPPAALDGGRPGPRPALLG